MILIVGQLLGFIDWTIRLRFQMQQWEVWLNQSQDEDLEVLLLQLLLLPGQGDNLCQEWLQGLPLLQVGHNDFRIQLDAIWNHISNSLRVLHQFSLDHYFDFLGQNATKPSRGRRTPARPSGPRPSGNQLARSWLLIPALSLKRKGGTFKPLHFYTFEHSRIFNENPASSFSVQECSGQVRSWALAELHQCHAGLWSSSSS